MVLRTLTTTKRSLSLSLMQTIDFSAPSGKSEAIDARESERDVHQRSVRDDHETAESSGAVFFLYSLSHMWCCPLREISRLFVSSRERAARFP